MRRQIHWVFVAAALLSGGFESVVWSAAAALAGIGPVLAQSAAREAPLTAGYMALGKPLRPVGLLRDAGDRYAESSFAPNRARILEAPALAMEIVHGRARSTHQRVLSGLHYAPPVLLALALLIYLRRPRAVHLVPRRR